MGEGLRRIAVTGASGYIGTLLIRRLEESDAVGGILALDVREPAPRFGNSVKFVRQDVSQPFPELFADHDIDTVVHLAYLLRQGRDREANRRVNVDGATHTLEACRRAGVRRVVYLSSTSVYGAHPDNPEALTEDMPARPVAGFQYSEDKLKSEKLIARFAADSPGLNACVLRCCPVMGPNADNFIARAFDKPFQIAVSGANPPMQLIHEDDMVRCLEVAVLGNAAGLYNLAGSGSIGWREMASARGRRVFSMPPWLLYPATQLTWALRLQSDSPALGLDMVRHPWIANTGKIEREMGFRPRFSSREAWEAFIGNGGKR